jgi:hypothetical protein
MFQPPDYKPYVPAFTSPLWSIPIKPSEEEKNKIWNEAINAAMILLYEEGQHNEIVMPLKALLK